VAAITPAAVLAPGDNLIYVEYYNPIVLVLRVEKIQLKAVYLIHVRRPVENSDHLPLLAGEIVKGFLA
jgi:hypothetical protein